MEALSSLRATWSFVGNGEWSLIAARPQLLIDKTNYYVTAKTTYIRLLHGKIGFFWVFFRP